MVAALKWALDCGLLALLALAALLWTPDLLRSYRACGEAAEVAARSGRTFWLPTLLHERAVEKAELASARRRWREAGLGGEYELDVRRGPGRAFRLRVRGGEAVGTVSSEDGRPLKMSRREMDSYTVAALFERAEEAIVHADVFEAMYDFRYGYPVWLHINWRTTRVRKSGLTTVVRGGGASEVIAKLVTAPQWAVEQ